MNFLFALLFSSLAAAAVLRQNTTNLTPFTFLGKCDVPAGYGVPTVEELGGLSSHSTRRCQTFSTSPTVAGVAALSLSIAKRRYCCVKKHGAGKCTTLRKLGNAEVVMCGEAGWCHPCGMVAVLVYDIGKNCKWGDGWEVYAAGTWNVKAKGRGNIVVIGM